MCFAHTPSLAWALSGHFHPEIDSWDLWEVPADRVNGYEVIPFDYGDGGTSTEDKEYRVYERIYKRDIWYVATRTAS